MLIRQEITRMTGRSFLLTALWIVPAWADGLPQFNAIQKRWWAIQPVKASQPPPVDVTARPWVRNEIDHFVYDKLKAKGLRPSPPASREVFLRRVTLDLTGLPPTPA
ncbi:MAG: DUF1549 domain-containing protein, partial [Acidobacteriota bacterium]